MLSKTEECELSSKLAWINVKWLRVMCIMVHYKFLSLSAASRWGKVATLRDFLGFHCPRSWRKETKKLLETSIGLNHDADNLPGKF